MTSGFCLNSRRWLVFMDAWGIYPKTCPYDGDCDQCGYFVKREETDYLRRKLKLQSDVAETLPDGLFEEKEPPK